MVETGCPDLEIFNEVTEGIKLVGSAHESQAFPRADTSSAICCSQAVCEGRLQLASVDHLAMLQPILSFGSSL